MEMETNNTPEQKIEKVVLSFDDILQQLKQLSGITPNPHDQPLLQTCFKHSTTVLLMGFGNGYLAVLGLHTNPYLKVVCIDDGKQACVGPCYQYLQSIYGPRLQLHIGESEHFTMAFNQLSLYRTFDCVLINDCIEQDEQRCIKHTISCLKYMKNHAKLIFTQFSTDLTVSLWTNVLSNTHVFKPSALNARYVNTSILVLDFCRPSYAICTLAKGDAYRCKVQNCLESKYEYCQQYGYELITDDEFEIGKLGFGWYKIFQLKKYLDQYDFLFWFDADAQITNYNVCLDIMFLFLPKQYGGLISNDPNGINTGIMLIQNNNVNKLWLNNCDKMKDELLYTGIYEQLPLMHLLNYNVFPNMFYIVNQNLWNAYDTEIWRKDIPTFDGHQDGDFMIHFAGYRDTADRNLADGDQLYKSKRGYFQLPFKRYMQILFS